MKAEDGFEWLSADDDIVKEYIELQELKAILKVVAEAGLENMVIGEVG